MDRYDTEMNDADPPMSPPPPQHDPIAAARNLLSLARQLINEGKAPQALQAVVMAMGTQGGNEAVVQFLNRARELYTKRLQENTAADQLASLFAECAIAEAQPLRAEEASSVSSGPSVVQDAQENSILAETGRTQIMLDAFSDGSSFICLKCGGLVSKERKDEHYAYWCSKL